MRCAHRIILMLGSALPTSGIFARDIWILPGDVWWVSEWWLCVCARFLVCGRMLNYILCAYFVGFLWKYRWMIVCASVRLIGVALDACMWWSWHNICYNIYFMLTYRICEYKVYRWIWVCYRAFRGGSQCLNAFQLSEFSATCLWRLPQTRPNSSYVVYIIRICRMTAMTCKSQADSERTSYENKLG